MAFACRGLGCSQQTQVCPLGINHPRSSEEEVDSKSDDVSRNSRNSLRCTIYKSTLVQTLFIGTQIDTCTKSTLRHGEDGHHTLQQTHPPPYTLSLSSDPPATPCTQSKPFLLLPVTYDRVQHGTRIKVRQRVACVIRLEGICCESDGVTTSTAERPSSLIWAGETLDRTSVPLVNLFPLYLFFAGESR
jgi:hypothetical protein